MDYFEDDLHAEDYRGLNGYDRLALERVKDFLDQLLRGSRVYGLSGHDVMTIQQSQLVVGDFPRVRFDGFVKISAATDDGQGVRSSNLEITTDKILIGVSGYDNSEYRDEPYSDTYFIIGNQDESDTLDDDLAVWEEEFFEKLTRPTTTLQIEGEIMNIEAVIDDQETDDQDDEDEFN